MTIDNLFQIPTQAVFLLIFARVGIRAVKYPRRVNVDIALLFGAVAGAILPGMARDLAGLEPPEWLSDVTAILLMALPYLLLRLADDFAGVPSGLRRAAEAGLLGSAAAVLLSDRPLPAPVTLGLVGYFVALMCFDAVAFVRLAAQTAGITRRRMLAVSAGSGLLALAVLLAGVQALLPDLAGIASPLARATGLATAITYLLGFDPPAWLRQIWRDPETRAFLTRAAALPSLTDTRAIITELERGIALTLGAPGAFIGVWDERHGAIRFHHHPLLEEETIPEQL